MRTLTAIGLLLIASATGSAFASQSDGPDSTQEMAIVRFVHVEHEHGVPFKEAHAFGSVALPTLVTLLGDARHKDDWDNVVQTICYIGTPAGFEPLRAFIQDRFQGEVDSETFQALGVAQACLGLIAAASPAALDYLIKGTDPAYWSTLRWTHEGRQGAKLGLLWSKLSINALSMTGTPKAGEVLERLQRSPHSERQRSNIEEGLARHKKIMEIGLIDYLFRRETGEINN